MSDALNPVQVSKIIRFNHMFYLFLRHVVHHVKHETVLHFFWLITWQEKQFNLNWKTKPLMAYTKRWSVYFIWFLKKMKMKMNGSWFPFINKKIKTKTKKIKKWVRTLPTNMNLISTPSLLDESLESDTPRTPADKCTWLVSAAAVHTAVPYGCQSRCAVVQAWFWVCFTLEWKIVSIFFKT